MSSNIGTHSNQILDQPHVPMKWGEMQGSETLLTLGGAVDPISADLFVLTLPLLHTVRKESIVFSY